MDTQPDWASPDEYGAGASWSTGWTVEQAIDWLQRYPWGSTLVAQLAPQREPQEVRRWLRRVAELHARLHADAGANYAIDSGDDNGADDVAGKRAMAADLYE